MGASGTLKQVCMKKFLIISDGTIGHNLIERVIATYSSENFYYIIQTRISFITYDVHTAYYKFSTFDPTSFHKLAELLNIEFVQVFIALEDAQDTLVTIKNIRTLTHQLRIVVLDQFALEINDPNIVAINANEILASRLIDYLPNVPVIAQNVGLGEGEIMEVLVPFGSSFVYRHVGVIEQKNWRIVAIYRNRELIIPERKTMIQPNDLLLLVGDPAVLKSVYRAIKRELGQFPAPFGTNLYLFIDMAIESEENIINLRRRSEFVHSEFGNEMIIKVVNPGSIDLLQKIKSYRSNDVNVDIDYENSIQTELILSDIKSYHIGLVIVSKPVFWQQNIRKALYEGNVPVLNMADRSISGLKEAVVVLSDNRDLEKVSTAIFDISEQMGYNLELLNYAVEHQEAKEQVIEHYNNLSTIFSKSIKVIDQDENPIRSLQRKDNFLHCLPFTEKVTEKPIMSLFSTDSERLYYRLDDYHQLFIPVRI